MVGHSWIKKQAAFHIGSPDSCLIKKTKGFPIFRRQMFALRPQNKILRGSKTRLNIERYDSYLTAVSINVPNFGVTKLEIIWHGLTRATKVGPIRLTKQTKAKIFLKFGITNSDLTRKSYSISPGTGCVLFVRQSLLGCYPLNE